MSYHNDVCQHYSAQVLLYSHARRHKAPRLNMIEYCATNIPWDCYWLVLLLHQQLRSKPQSQLGSAHCQGVERKSDGRLITQT